MRQPDLCDGCMRPEPECRRGDVVGLVTVQVPHPGDTGNSLLKMQLCDDCRDRLAAFMVSPRFRIDRRP